MQRRLILMRHAKSSWASAGLTDHARPLNPRGRRDAPRVADALVHLGWTPARVLLSDAQRTRETWAGMAPRLPEVPTSLHPTLYLAGLPAIEALAHHWPDDLQGPVLLLGHNPGWEDAATTLSGRSHTLTTANAVLLVGDGASWSEALAGEWSVASHLKPRTLPDSAAPA